MPSTFFFSTPSFCGHAFAASRVLYACSTTSGAAFVSRTAMSRIRWRRAGSYIARFARMIARSMHSIVSPRAFDAGAAYTAYW